MSERTLTRRKSPAASSSFIMPKSLAGSQSDAARPGADRAGGSAAASERAFGGQVQQEMQLASIQPAFDHAFQRLAVGRPHARLTASQPGDDYEHGAKRLEDQAMRQPDATIQRACAGPGCCEHPKYQKEQDQKLARQAAGDHGMPEDGTDVTPLVQGVIGSGAGQPLDAQTRAFMEPRFGHDFSQVRVHTDGRAAESARAVNARAYTVGNHVVFGEGQAGDVRLLAHELTHVVQDAAQRNQAYTEPLLHRFSEAPHAEIEEPVLASLFGADKEAARQVSLGNWQNDFNQISLALPILNRIPFVNMDKSDCFDIANIIAEDKFGPVAAHQMTQERFGEYKPTQHFDNPLLSGTGLGTEAVPAYIQENKQELKTAFRRAVEAGEGRATGTPRAREYLGSALHIIEDFYAHTNFVEVALKTRKAPGEIDTYGGRLASGKYRLVSGNFEPSDAVVSILKILAGYLSPPSTQGPSTGEKRLSTGERILIIMIRKKHRFIAKLLEMSLKTVDWAENKAINWAKRKVPGFAYAYAFLMRIKDTVSAGLSSAVQGLSKGAAVFTGRGTQPSHTAVNKDDPTRARYLLAKQLAEHAVSEVAREVLAAWNKPLDLSTLANIDKLVDEYTAHPDDSNWWYSIVDNYIANQKKEGER